MLRVPWHPHIPKKIATPRGNGASFSPIWLMYWTALDVRAYPSEQGLSVYFRDSTDRHTTERQLRERQETLTALINSSTDAINSSDTSGHITLLNPTAERIFQRSQDSMLGKNVQLLMPERFRAAHPQQQRFKVMCCRAKALGSEPIQHTSLNHTWRLKRLSNQ